LTEARGFFVWTEDIFDQTKWSDPIYLDSTGIDQDVGLKRDSGSEILHFADPILAFL
jgi:hypothetical protein